MRGTLNEQIYKKKWSFTLISVFNTIHTERKLRTLSMLWLTESCKLAVMAKITGE